MNIQFANTDWKGRWKEHPELSCNEAWNVFQTEYKIAVDKHVPMKKVKANRKSLWMKSGVKKAVRKNINYTCDIERHRDTKIMLSMLSKETPLRKLLIKHLLILRRN